MSADFFADLFKEISRTPEQKTCSHILSSQMHDGKFFCPSCKLVSPWPLKKERPA